MSPPGIDNGARLRVKGEGNAGRRGAPPGDLIVYIRVKDHPELRREGIDIHSDIDISYVDAILGSQVGVHFCALVGQGCAPLRCDLLTEGFLLLM
jgi:molecular chaperone DnaJ